MHFLFHGVWFFVDYGIASVFGEPRLEVFTSVWKSKYEVV